MALFDIDMMSIAQRRMGYSVSRQAVVAENVAQADTPNTSAKELSAFAFDQELTRARLAHDGLATQDPGQLRATDVHHVRTTPENGFAPERSVEAWEVVPSDNDIVLEQQMLQMAESKMQYDQAAAYYKKAADLLRAAMSARF